jgi:ankyrin repeat protein
MTLTAARLVSLAGCVFLAAASFGAPAQSALTPQQKARLAETDAFQSAVAKKDAAAVRRLIARGVKPDFNFDEVTRGRSGESPLTMAIGRGHLEIARILLEAGADARRRDGFDQSPLDRARTAQAVELLLAHGADMNSFGRRGLTALELAIERRDEPTVQVLLAHGARLELPRQKDVLKDAAERGDTAALRILLAAGADPRNPPTKAIPALMERGDDAGTVQLLLERGADPNARTQWNETLVERALFRKRWNILQRLADAGAILQPADEPACQESAWKCHSIQTARLATLDPPTLAHLKARGLDLNRTAANGHTALTSLLVEPPGVRIMAVTPDGRTGPALEPPQELPRIRALLEQGADPNRKYRDFTPLMLAVAVPQKPREIADAIVDSGGRVEFDYTIPKASPEAPAKAYALPAPATAILEMPIVVDPSGVLKGRTVGPLTWLVLHRRADLASRILARDRRLPGADRYVLYFAAMLGEWNFVLDALKYTREVDAGDRAGVTPLLIAADDGRADAVKALIAAGADVNARSDRDWPPLWETPPSMLFMGHGPSKPRLVGGYTPLKIAKERNREEVVRILQQARAKD